MGSEKREDTEPEEDRIEKIVIDRVIRREAVEEADLEAVLEKLDIAVAELTDALGEDRVSTDPVVLKPYGKVFYTPVEKSLLGSVASTGILVLPATEEEVAAVVEIAERHSIPVTSFDLDTNMESNAMPSGDGAIIMDLRLMGKRISKPSDIPPPVIRFILERWSDHLKPVRQRFVEAGLVGESFTEKAPGLPLGKLNYYFDQDGVLRFDFESEEDMGQTIITYKDFETGFRALSDKNFDSMKAFLDGAFKLEPSADAALKMAPMMPDMIEAHIKAIRDAEKKFKVELPKY